MEEVKRGARKSDVRKKLMRQDLTEMIMDNTLKDIAEKFGASIEMVANEAQVQFDKKSIGFKDKKVISEMNMRTGAAWMDSPNRQYYIHYKSNLEA